MTINRRALVLWISLAGAGAVPAWASADNLVVSSASPRLTLRIDQALRRLPSMAFPIETMTNARREIFVDADGQHRIRRAVIVQFETVQAGSDFRFRYPPRPPQTFGAETYRFGAFAYEDPRAAAANPNKEAGLTRAHLIRQGLQPPRVWRAARLARVSDPQGLSEVIIFYFENADGLYPQGPLAGADQDGDLDLDADTRALLLERLRAAVTVVEG
jgi:hypothetical protein